MRQPKFRGFCIETKEWHYGHGWFTSDYTEEYKQEMGIEDTAILLTDGYPVECELQSMGQYTGLQDSKGKELFEGDLLQDEKGIGEVEWVQEHCAFLVFTRNPSAYHKLESDGILNKTEVIGNIYEHPHLLEVESNG